MHIEILQSPWLCELMACYINLKEENANEGTSAVLSEVCSFTFCDDKPILSCEIFEALKVHVDLKCAICLVSPGLGCLITYSSLAAFF